MPRKTTPTKLKIVKGETRPSQHNLEEPEVEPTGLPAPPAHLNRWAKAEWKRMAPLIEEWVCTVDLTTFEAYCDAYGDYRKAAAKLAKSGHTIKGSRGWTRRPESYVKREAIDRMVRTAAECGFTPSSRTKVKRLGKKKAKDPAEEFFR